VSRTKRVNPHETWKALDVGSSDEKCRGAREDFGLERMVIASVRSDVRTKTLAINVEIGTENLAISGCRPRLQSGAQGRGTYTSLISQEKRTSFGESRWTQRCLGTQRTSFKTAQ
jgi:hypothetical protein